MLILIIWLWVYHFRCVCVQLNFKKLHCFIYDSFDILTGGIARIYGKYKKKWNFKYIQKFTEMKKCFAAALNIYSSCNEQLTRFVPFRGILSFAIPFDIWRLTFGSLNKMTRNWIFDLKINFLKCATIV